MQHQNNIDKRVDETLDLLNNIQPVESNPFLFEKIKSRIEDEKKSTVKKPTLILQTARLTAMSCLILLNIYIMGNLNSVDNLNSQEANLSEESIDYIIESYGISSSEDLIYN